MPDPQESVPLQEVAEHLAYRVQSSDLPREDAVRLVQAYDSGLTRRGAEDIIDNPENWYPMPFGTLWLDVDD